MQTLQAVIFGKVVSYPMTTTFTIEKRIKGTKREFGLVATRNNIADAVAKYHRVAETGTIVRLSCAVDGKIRKLHQISG